MFEWFKRWRTETTEDETAIELSEQWEATPEEKRRVFIFWKLGTPDVDGKISAQNMAVMEEWLKSGQIKTVSAKPTGECTLLDIRKGAKQ